MPGQVPWPGGNQGALEPVEIYELTGTASVQSRFQAGALRGLTRFVGRDLEMEQFRLALEDPRRLGWVSVYLLPAGILGHRATGRCPHLWPSRRSGRRDAR